MERPSVFRFLRYAVTALSVMACVLLVALWVRSYWWWDGIYGPGAPSAVSSLQGRLHFVFQDFAIPPVGWTVTSREVETLGDNRPRLSGWESSSGFDVEVQDDLTVIAVPNWFLVALLGTISAVPWVKSFRRFSLRTLLIATTLVAVGLGIIVMAM